MAISDLFKHLAFVAKYTESSTSTAYGRKTFSFVESSTGYPCLLQRRTQNNRSIVGVDYQASVYDAVVYAGIGLAATESDRLIIDGKTYDIIAIRDAAGQGHHLEVEARTVQP